MTCETHASLHLGPSAEAMARIDPLLISPLLGGLTGPGRARQTALLPVMFLVALMLLPGAPIVQESGFRQLARALECASRCNTPPVNAAARSTLSH